MGAARGDGISKQDRASFKTQLRPMLDEEEKLRAVVRGGDADRRLHVVTNDRMVYFDPVSGAIEHGFATCAITQARAAADDVGPIVQVWLRDEGFWLLRTGSDRDADILRTALLASADLRRAEMSDGPLRPTVAPSGSSALAVLSGDHLTWVVDRRDVERCYTREVLAALQPLLADPSLAARFVESVAIYFDGYNDDSAELHEVEAVRLFVQKLDVHFPYWLFFADKESSTFEIVWRCSMPAFLTPAEQQKVVPERLEQLLRNWWFPAMNAMCGFVQVPASARDALTERAVAYMQGRRSF